jgi:DNA-binding NarL/FixJ family response regulator
MTNRMQITHPSSAQPSSANGRPRVLTKRQAEVLTALAAGATLDEVAAQLSLSRETVRSHIRTACVKLRARNRLQAVARAVNMGEIALDDRLPEVWTRS